MIGPRSDRQLFWILGLTLVVSYAYFYQAGGWNQNSRFALVRALLEQHTLQIDAYRQATGDRAVLGGHYYSDKAPGASLLALIPTDAARALSFATGRNPTTGPGVAWTSYVATVATSGVLTAVAALCVLWLSLLWGYSRNAAIFAATAYGVAGPAWCYATLFMGHGVSAGCLMIAFTTAVALGQASDARAPRLSWIVGLSAGWAVVSEFPAAVPVVFIVVLAMLDASARNARRLPGVLARIVAGGAIMALVLMAYNAAAFGSPFHLGYASEEGFGQMQTGLFGLSRPEWWRVREILFGSYRGLLPISPLVAVTPIGVAVLATASGRRRPALVAAAIAVFYLLLNASYFYWEGGWAFGPRQVMPALPFLALGLAPLWDRWRRAGRAVLAAAWLWGAAVTLVAVSTTPQPQASINRPVSELLVPAFVAGHLSLNTQGFTDYRPGEGDPGGYTSPRASWNLGMKMGLRGLPSLAPLGAVWLACALWLMAGAAERTGAAAGPQQTSPPAARGSA